MKKTNIEQKYRLSIFKSNKYIYGQIINDETGTTIVGNYPHSYLKSTDKTTQVIDSAKELAGLSKKAGFEKIFFDRRKYRYQGRVKQFAEELRKQGLKF